MRLALLVVASFLVACIGSALLAAWLRKRRLLDVPNERSSHTVPTPRGGGGAILLALGVAALLAALAGLPAPPPVLALGVSAVALVGLWDDWSGKAPWGARLAVHAGAAFLVARDAGGFALLPLPPPLDVSLGPAAVPLAALWIVAVLNFVNFLDGIDALAGLQLAASALVAGLLVGGFWAWLGPCLAAACAGFLVWNRPPARIFLGDVGSGALGFLLAAAPLAPGEEGLGVGAATFALAISLSPFLFDATFTLLRRLARGERVWAAHRSHVYQRLVATGLSHGAVSARMGLAAALLSAVAVAAARAPDARAGWLALALGAASFALFWSWATARERSRGAAREP